MHLRLHILHVVPSYQLHVEFELLRSRYLLLFDDMILLNYDYLIVATGTKTYPDETPGLQDKLWYKENIVFDQNGVYTIELSHAMRQNGKVEGIDNLMGITDVGIEVERRIEK